MNAHGRVGVVTGASGGIGSAIVRSLADRGYQVIAVGRDKGKLCNLAGAAGSVVWDASAAPEAVPEELAALDRVDVLVHNAGVAPIFPVQDMKAGAFVDVLSVNLVAAVTLTQTLLSALRAARGHVVLVNSSAGSGTRPGWSAYLASKAGLREFADALRAEEAATGVRVTTVFPGAVATQLLRSVREGFGRTYDPSQLMSPATAARLITSVLDHPDDGYLTDVVFTRSPGD